MSSNAQRRPWSAISPTPQCRLVAFLEEISRRLSADETVADEFSQESLAELGIQFNLTASDWTALDCMIHIISR
jgi:hypothetical protein